MDFDDLRAGLRRGVEDAPQDDHYQVDLALILLKLTSELSKLVRTIEMGGQDLARIADAVAELRQGQEPDYLGQAEQDAKRFRETGVLPTLA